MEYVCILNGKKVSREEFLKKHNECIQHDIKHFYYVDNIENDCITYLFLDYE